MKELDTFVKIVVVGDSFVGKSWMLSTFVDHGRLPQICGPTLFDHMSTPFLCRDDNIEYELSIWDCSGIPQRKKLRCLAYPNVDVFLVCYAIDSRASFENVKFRWLPELRRKCPGVPRILLGLKSDLRDKVPNPVSSREGEFMQLEIQATSFFEYSITTPKMLNGIFDEAIRAARLKKSYCKKNACVIQ